MLVPDDRDKGKCWLVPTASMATHLEMALEADSAAWQRRSDITKQAADAWQHARGELGMPEWLLKYSMRRDEAEKHSKGPNVITGTPLCRQR